MVRVILAKTVVFGALSSHTRKEAWAGGVGHSGLYDGQPESSRRRGVPSMFSPLAAGKQLLHLFARVAGATCSPARPDCLPGPFRICPDAQRPAEGGKARREVFHRLGDQMGDGHTAIQGFSKMAPVPLKSPVLRVTTVKPWTNPVAAISASRSDLGSGT